MTSEEFALHLLSYVGTAYLYETSGACPENADMAWAKDRLQACRDRGQWRSVRESIEEMMHMGIISGNVTDGVFLDIPVPELDRFAIAGSALVVADDDSSEHAKLIRRLIIGYICGEPLVISVGNISSQRAGATTCPGSSLRPTYAWRNPPPQAPVIGS